MLHRCVVAQELLHGVRDALREQTQLTGLLGVIRQGHQRVAEKIDGGLVSGCHQNDGGAQEFGVRQLPVDLVAHCDQARQQVVLGTASLLLKPLSQVRVEGEETGTLPVGRVGHRRAGPGLEVAAALGRYAEQLADDGHRQRTGVDGGQVGLPRGGEGVDVLMGELLDPWCERVDRAGGECAGHQAPQTGVPRRVGHEHVAAESGPGQQEAWARLTNPSIS
nr:hypothetical protein [Streptomyces chromofuscus]